LADHEIKLKIYRKEESNTERKEGGRANIGGETLKNVLEYSRTPLMRMLVIRTANYQIGLALPIKISLL
jgi:hypothetical protein